MGGKRRDRYIGLRPYFPILFPHIWLYFPIEHFPDDFISRLTVDEVEALNLSQFATGSQKHRDPRFTPFAFTEHGAIMAAAILKSPRAAEMSVYVVRAFVRLREVLASNSELAKRLDDLEQSTEALSMQHDTFARNARAQIKQAFDAVN